MKIPESLRLAQKFHAAGQRDQAEMVYRQILMVQPNHSRALNGLGLLALWAGQGESAVDLFRRAIAAEPGIAQFHLNLGTALHGMARVDEAVAEYRTAVALMPDYSPAYNNLGQAAMEQGDAAEALACFERVARLAPGDFTAASNRLLALHYHPDWTGQAILREHRIWQDRFARPLAELIQPHRNDPDPARRLKIGYVGPDFRQHVVGWNLQPLLRERERDRFEIFAYSNVGRADAGTERLKRQTDFWRDIYGISDEQAAEMIRDDAIDILVDLSLHGGGNRLLVFARKPAPVQVCYLGYPGTTGISAIDYRLSDPYLDPKDSDLTCYSEKTIRLPATYWCYQPGGTAPRIQPAPAITNGHVTFGCLNNFSKVSGPTLDLWAELLAAADRSRLLLYCPSAARRQALRERLDGRGISSDRLDFLGQQPFEDYARTYHRIDVALDPFPFGGGITTCDSLWMGVPVVSLRGPTAAGRGGASILSNIGLPELVAETPRQYLDIAADWPRLIALRPTLRQRMLNSPLMDAKRFARDVEAVYRAIWRTWCERKEK